MKRPKKTAEHLRIMANARSLHWKQRHREQWNAKMREYRRRWKAAKEASDSNEDFVENLALHKERNKVTMECDSSFIPTPKALVSEIYSDREVAVMPRAPKQKTPLRKLRDILSVIEGRTISQAMFAKRLAVSFPYINAIETGARPMTMDLALRISDAYGVEPKSLLAGSNEPTSAIQGSDLIAGIREWLDGEHFAVRNENASVALESTLIYKLRALFAAALEKRKGPFLQRRLETAIDGWIEDFNLDREYAEALREQSQELG